jgi:acetyl-CoA carboxylase carboxyltransferase component
MVWQDKIDELNRRLELARRGGAPDRIERQHERGRLTVRERLDRLLDPGSFHEIGALAGAGAYEHGRLVEFTPAPFVMGLGKIDGRHVAIGGEDFTIRGGSAVMQKHRSKGGDAGGFPEELAREYLIPLVLLIEGGGGNVQRIAAEGAPPLFAGNEAFIKAAEAMMYVPVVAAVLGNAAGGPAGRSVMVHWSVMTRETSAVFAAGPPVVRRALGIDVSAHELGGAHVQVRQSGVIDNEAEDEAAAFEQIRAFLSFMPSSVYELPPVRPFDGALADQAALADIVPRDRRLPYSMQTILRTVVDPGSLFEIKPYYGVCVITALARVNGHPIGIVANNPQVLGGAIDGDGAEKQAHFVDLCDYFRIPLVYFVDIPGFMIGPQAERAGTLRRGIRAAWAGMQATVPTLSIIVRKCYGMGGMTPGDARLRYRIAWPSGDWGILPIEGGVEAAFRREIEAAPDPAARRQELEEEFIAMSNILRTAEAFGVEEIIDPRETRSHLERFVEMAYGVTKHEVGQGPKVRRGVRP